jgi:hypothetical protein
MRDWHDDSDYEEEQEEPLDDEEAEEAENLHQLVAKNELYELQQEDD